MRLKIHKPIKMHRSLVAAAFTLSLLVLSTFVFTSYTFIYLPYKKKLAAAELTEVSSQIRSYIDNLLRRVETLAMISRDWGVSGMIDFEDHESFLKLYRPVLLKGPKVSSVVLAEDSGRDLLLVLLDRGHFMIRQTNPDVWGKMARFSYWDAEGKLVITETVPTDYDARTRPWFETGKKIVSEPFLWSEPFVFKSTQEVGLTVVTTWRNGGRNFILGVDLLRSDISSAINAKRPGSNGFSAVLSRDGEVIGLPGFVAGGDEGAKGAQARKSVDDLKLESLSSAFKIWQRHAEKNIGDKATEENTGSNVIEFRVAGEKWLGVMSKEMMGQLPIWIATLAPESDFIPEISSQLSWLLINALVILLVAWQLAVRLAHRFTRPIEKLAKHSALIGELKLDEPVPVSGSWLEVEELERSLEFMRRRLQTSTKELHKLNLSLENKIAQRTKALELSEYQARDAVIQLEAAAREKSEFLARVSHELRTPMTVISGLSHLGLKNISHEKRLSYIERINIASGKISRILDDLLDISKIEFGKLQIRPSPFDLQETILQVSKLMSFKAEEKNLDFDLDLPPAHVRYLVGDAARVGQILANLIGNAIKFTQEGGVRLKIELLQYEPLQERCRLRFIVKDSGPGIAPEAIPRLFISFSQLSTAHLDAFGGSGLGLAICKQLVELMEGVISVESQVGVGSQFIFELPFLIASSDFSLEVPKTDHENSDLIPL